MTETLEKPYTGLYKATSLSDLFNRHHFAPANVIELPRQLNGDFNGLARKLSAVLSLPADASHEIDRTLFRKLLRRVEHELSPDEMLAATHIDNDLRNIGGKLATVNLRINTGDAYANHDSGAAFRFHVDGSARLLCNYNEPAAQWLEIGDEEPDAEMMEQYGYAEYFAPKPGAEIHTLHTGHIYHFLGLMNTMDAPPFVHRGMQSGPDDPPRLLLVAEYQQEPSF